MLHRPTVITEVAFANNPDDARPTWTDISDKVKSSSIRRGRDSELSTIQPGTATMVLRNTDRSFDNSSGPNAGDVLPMKRVRQYIPGPLIGTEFWGDFEAGADGTAPEWTAMNGALECKAGAEARQLQFKTTPTPRVGSRIARFEVASGDQFGATSGERCEVRRGATNGGFGTGDLEGQTVYYQMSARWLAPWTSPGGDGIFWQMHDSGSTYGQPSFRWRLSATNYEFRVVTGTFPNSTDAGNGVNAGTDKTHTGRAFAADQWWDFRWAIYYTTSTAGWYIAQMKTDAETTWTDVARVGGVSTLQNYPGSSATSQFDKRGWYRAAHASTNVVFGDGYFVGHAWQDVAYTGFSTDSRLHDGWEGRERAAAQVGNPNFEADIVGTAAAGGGTTTRTWDTTRSHTGSGALKMVTNGAASGQGAFHTKRSLSRYDGIVAGDVVTAWAWFSGDGFEQVRIGIEWFDSGGASLSTSFAPARALRTDFRRHYLTATAPANAVTFRIRTSLSGTNAATFWVDDVDWLMGELDHFLFDGFAESWVQSWPDRLFDAECVLTCSDFFASYANAAMPVSNPNVENFQDVLSFDEPSFHYPFGDPAGTRATAAWRNQDPTWLFGITDPTQQTPPQVTISRAIGISGIPGTYKGTPTLGEPGMVLGESATSVRFTRANNEYVRVGPIDQNDLIDTNRLTLEMIVKLNSTGALHTLISGPEKSAASTPVFSLEVTSANKLEMTIRGVSTTRTFASTATLSSGTIYHVAGTWDGQFIRLYINGSLDSTSGSLSDTLQTGDAGGYLWIATFPAGGAADPTKGTDGWLQHVAIYEKQLSTARILAHSDARSRGFSQELSGTRIANAFSAASLTPLLYNVDAGQRSVLPVRQGGQAMTDVINQAVQAEGGTAMFFVSASGVSQYLDRNARSAYPYSTNQATFGDVDGEIPYLDVVFSNDLSFLYNEIRLQRVGGELQTTSDSTSQTAFRRRTYDVSGLLNVSDSDVSTEATNLLARYKDQLERITSVALSGDDLDAFMQALFREIGDQVTIKRRPKGGTAITQTSYIENVSHSIDFENRTWQTVFSVSPR